MGELVPGVPALYLSSVVSEPLALVSYLSLLHRAVPGSGLDPDLIATRRSLSSELRADLDLLHGFSGRLLYYPEEPVMTFAPLQPERVNAGLEDLLEFMAGLPPATYVEMAQHALARVHRDVNNSVIREAPRDEASWRGILEPGLTAASADDVVPILLNPGALKAKTIRLFEQIGRSNFRGAFAEHQNSHGEAARLAEHVIDRGMGLAFADLTGNRPPAQLVSQLTDIEQVVFIPSAWLGSYVSYILYPPDLVVYFDAASFILRAPGSSTLAPPSRVDAARLPPETLVDALRAVADPTRLTILELLGQHELYAQEIISRLGIAQSAASRHLGQLQRAGLVSVRTARGMKYYSVNQPQLDTIADSLRATGAPLAP